MHCDKLFKPSPYLAASDLNGKDVTLTIDRITTEDVKSDHGSELCPVIFFKEIKDKAMQAGKPERGMILNKVNGGRNGTIAGLYGTETDNWLNQRITLFPTTTMYKGKMTDCIRIRPMIPAIPRKPAAKPTATTATQSSQAAQPQSAHVAAATPIGLPQSAQPAIVQPITEPALINAAVMQSHAPAPQNGTALHSPESPDDTGQFGSTPDDDSTGLGGPYESGTDNLGELDDMDMESGGNETDPNATDLSGDESADAD